MTRQRSGLGFHSRANFCASACAGLIFYSTLVRPFLRSAIITLCCHIEPHVRANIVLRDARPVAYRGKRT